MSFLSSWWTGSTGQATLDQSKKKSEDEAPSISVTVEAPAEEEPELDDEDDDTPPSFPLANSIQRASSSSSGLGGAATRTGAGATSMGPPGAGALQLPPSTSQVPKKPRKKVALAPGHSPLDWARLKGSGADLRGVGSHQLLRVTPDMLKQHNTRQDAWTAINGSVYNISPYLDYHPGGVPELMRIAGRDGTKLFALTHSWVSADMMMGQECLVGFLVRE